MSIGQLTCARSPDTVHIFKQRADLHDDCLILPHHMQFTLMLSNPVYNASKLWKFSLILPPLDFAEILPLYTTTTLSMDTADYWQMVREYSIWNATIALLQFWTEDIDPVTLGGATECVYTTFFYSPSSHALCQQSNEILFVCFVIALHAAFDQQLSLADEGYKSGSDTTDLPTPLRKTPCIHHVSSMEHASFDPATYHTMQ